MKVWIDGRIVEGDQAHIPVTDHGLLYGDGIFEGMRIAGRRIFRLDAHLTRLTAAAKALALELPGGAANVRDIVLATARAYDADEAYVRLILTRGVGGLGVDPTTCRDPRLICLVDDIRIYPAEKLKSGIELVTSSLRRPGPDVLDPRIKSLNYLNMLQLVTSNSMSGVFIVEDEGLHVLPLLRRRTDLPRNGKGLGRPGRLLPRDGSGGRDLRVHEGAELPEERTITANTQFLILEGLRQMDETGAG